jgi:dienelactone hydrolase
LDLRARDGTGAVWEATAAFRAAQDGTVDLDRAAPKYGDYTGVWGAGLISSMSSVSVGSSAFVWPRDGARFTLDVRADGKRVATAEFRRSISRQPLRRLDLTLGRTGVSGVFFSPAHARSRPAMLVFGGSEGGRYPYLDALAEALTAHGYPTLAIAYFGAPGLPQELARIPLEYFAAALRWLDRRAEVDRRRVSVLGISRGSEAAQLLGVHFPALVHGVVASVPSNVAVCSLPDCGPTWTLGGRALPFTRQFNQPHPTDDPAAVIPDDRIDGPLLAVCALHDTIWQSCAYAHAILARLAAHHDPHPHVLYTADAGHFAGSFLPYQPARAFRESETEREADARAREKLWPKLLAFLSAHA